MEDYCVITFQITQHALIFEKNMKELGYSIKLMPVPRQVSSSCGTAAKIPCDKKEEILNICNEKNLPIEDFHRIEHKKKSWF
ncbi:MAG: DUF3343 domain-containing protein [Tissierellia bacterium]|nr:DUF3343 domain-containing protein [Tissierellia bacterium]